MNRSRHKIGQRSRFLALLGALCLVAAACASEEGGETTTEPESTSTTESGTTDTTESPTTTSSAPAELTDVTFRTGFGCDSWDAGWYIAQELGYYEEVGLDVTIGCGQGSNSNVQLVGAKQETFAHVSGSALASATAQGADVRMVASFLQTGGAGIAAQADIQTIEDMVGRVFAGPSFDYVTGFVTPTFETAAGLEVGSITVQNTDGYFPLFLAGEVDMMPALGWAEVPQLQTEGHPFNFFPFADYGLDLMGPGLVTHADTLAENPEMVAAFAAASQRGWQFAYDNPEEATEIISGILTEIDPEVHRAVIDSLPAFAHRPASEGKNLGWLAESDFEELVQLMVDNELLEEPIDVSNLFMNVLPENA